MPDGVLEIRERGGVGNLELSYQNHNQIHFVCKTPLKFCYLTFTTGISVGFSISIFLLHRAIRGKKTIQNI